MELSVGEMRTADGLFFTGFVRDHTERQQAEARLQELQGELVQVSRLTALGEMASALAHELNQPLTAIANYLKGSRRLLAATPVPLDRISEAVGRAADQALRAGEIIRRLRDFVARGESELRIEDLPKLIEEASALALVGAREHGVRVTFALDPAVGEVLADRVQVQQVLLKGGGAVFHFTLQRADLEEDADVPLAVEAMKAGAVDFIEKPFDDEILLAAIRAALARGRRRDAREDERARAIERLAVLSAREREVLAGLVAGHANKVIAYDLNISPRTVEVYRANVMSKTGAASLSDLVRLSLTAGDEAPRP
jgi:DNA-binding CsgD family transcriptional regulator